MVKAFRFFTVVLSAIAAFVFWLPSPAYAGSVGSIFSLFDIQEGSVNLPAEAKIYQFYLYSSQGCNTNDQRCGMNLSFTDKTAKLYPQNDVANRVPWLFESATDYNSGQFYLFNTWNCATDNRCGMNLSFEGQTVKLYPYSQTGDWVPWKFDRVLGTTDQYYISSRWGCASNNYRCGLYLGLSGQDVVLSEARVPWKAVPLSVAAHLSLP